MDAGIKIFVMLAKLKEFLKKYKRLILIILAILLILIIGFFSLPAPKKEVTSEKTIPGAALVQTAATVTTEASATEKAKSSITVVAKNFAEVYGSYSNQSNYENIETAMLLAAAKYKSALASLLSRYRASYQPAANYEGVTTTVISQPEVESLDETSGKAVVLVKTQRKESAGMQANYTIKYQNIRISLIKEKGDWVVDGSSWLSS